MRVEKRERGKRAKVWRDVYVEREGGKMRKRRNGGKRRGEEGGKREAYGLFREEGSTRRSKNVLREGEKERGRRNKTKGRRRRREFGLKRW